MVCEKEGCFQTYNRYRTEPEMVGAGKEVTDEFIRRCKTSKLCDSHLYTDIQERFERNKALQD